MGYAHTPDLFDPAQPILERLTDRRARALAEMSWVDYLRSPEWRDIRSWMLRAYPASQISGTTENLEVHHCRPCSRARERPRDLVVATALEHRTTHSSTDPIQVIEWLIDHENDPRWCARLTDYARHISSTAMQDMPSVRALIEEIENEQTND